MEYKLKKLKNGLRVLVVPMENTETVTVTTLIKTGVQNEEEKNLGVSHFLEHMFFKGTKNYPSAKIQNERLDKIGAVHNAFTSYDETVYYVKVHRKHIKTAIHFFGDALQNALLEESEINRERGVIIEEMRMIQDNPQRQVWYEFAKNMFGDQRAGWEIVGSEKTLATMNRSVLSAYWKKQYVPSNMVLVIAGNVDVDTVFELADKDFSGLKKGTAKVQKKYSGPAKGPSVHICEKSTDQSHMMFGFSTLPAGHTDEAVLNVFATILGGSMSSRLWREIRERRGLAYTVSADNDSLKQYGFFGIYAGAPAKAIPNIIAIITKELKNIIEKGVRDTELQLAKEKIRGGQAMRLELTNNVALGFGETLLIQNTVETPKETMQKIDAVTREDVQRVAKRFCKKSNYYLSVIGKGLDQGQLLDVIKKS